MDGNKKLHGLIFNLHLGCESQDAQPHIAHPHKADSGQCPLSLRLRFIRGAYVARALEHGDLRVFGVAVVFGGELA